MVLLDKEIEAPLVVHRALSRALWRWSTKCVVLMMVMLVLGGFCLFFAAPGLSCSIRALGCGMGELFS